MAAFHPFSSVIQGHTRILCFGRNCSLSGRLGRSTRSEAEGSETTDTGTEDPGTNRAGAGDRQRIWVQVQVSKTAQTFEEAKQTGRRTTSMTNARIQRHL